MKYWKKAGFIATMVIVLTFPAYLTRIFFERSQPAVKSGPFFTGNLSCVECHKKEDDLRSGLHHYMAMDTATAANILGNFDNYEFRYKGETHHMFRKDGKFFLKSV